MKIVSLALRVLLSVVFVGAGAAKLAGVEMMVATFDTIGWGQWFRYVTAAVEIGSVGLLWVPGLQLLGAGLLMITMICAALFHLLVLGPSALPSLVLAVLCGVLVFHFWRKSAAIHPQ
ncbi:MAG: DoxX family protein [Pseudomonadota bacterium]